MRAPDGARRGASVTPKATSALETPMMKQYLEIKAKHPNSFLFYRMGDFYELFLEDARKAAPLLEITLTTRDKGKIDPVAMCGVPVHSADAYVKRLGELGHRVAICEQVEAPSSGGASKLMRREVVEVITPGLVGDPQGIDSRTEVSLVALLIDAEGGFGLAALDASTGDFRGTHGGAEAGTLLLEEIERIQPREILAAPSQRERLEALVRESLPETAWTEVPEQSFEPRTARVCPDGFDREAAGTEMRAAAAILAYLEKNQPAWLRHAPRFRSYALTETMVVDTATRTHLELFANQEDGSRRHTLIECLDRAVTPPGGRRIARWLRYPLLLPEAIRERQDAVAFLAERDRRRQRLAAALAPVRDLERLLARAVRPAATPRDLVALRASLASVPGVCGELSAAAGEDTSGEWLTGAVPLPKALPLPEPEGALTARLEAALVDNPPELPRGSRGAGTTGYIREGFRSELDVLRKSASKGRDWIAGLEARERERTGIPTLKARFHPVHGYSLEVAKAHLAKIPDDYERKQTLASVERYTTPGLREIESDVMGAQERAAALEREILDGLRNEVVAAAAPVRMLADRLADLDATLGLATVAREEAWTRPEVETGAVLEIEAGRHPVVEALLRSRGQDDFVPNDCNLDPASAPMWILTGPNMSGKSTYLRQVGLITLLAQMGSWVPAERARIGVVDRIFTRVGASDRLARGESTFMVEMRETAQILEQASSASLVILDEIGRGTSTYDGLAIAWSVIEYLHDTEGLCPRTLFATHYHELTELAEAKSKVRNLHFEAREWGNDVVFLRKLVPGGASRSYGVQVARLAGLPEAVVERAFEILGQLESARGVELKDAPGVATQGLLPLHSDSAAPRRSAAEAATLEELRGLDAERVTPFDALALLARLSKRVKDGQAP
jgi:DNA mismatch repair protein MutS